MHLAARWMLNCCQRGCVAVELGLSAADAAQSVAWSVSWSRAAHTNTILWKCFLFSAVCHKKMVLGYWLKIGLILIWASPWIDFNHNHVFGLSRATRVTQWIPGNKCCMWFNKQHNSYFSGSSTDTWSSFSSARYGRRRCVCRGAVMLPREPRYSNRLWQGLFSTCLRGS